MKEFKPTNDLSLHRNLHWWEKRHQTK